MGFKRFSKDEISRNNLKLDILVLLLLIAIAILIYLPYFSLPFIQDDYQILNCIRIDGLKYIVNYFLDIGNHHYRPIPQLLFYLFYQCISIPLYFHIFGLMLLILDSFFLYKIFFHILDNKRVSCYVSILFLTSYYLISNVMKWMVGIYDLLSFGLAAIGFLLILKGRYRWGNLLFLLAFLCKESVVFSILIPIIYFFIFDREKISDYLRKSFWIISLYLIVIITRFIGIYLNSSLPSAYSFNVSGIHIVTRCRYYFSTFLLQFLQNISLYSILTAKEFTLAFYLALSVILILIVKYKKIYCNKHLTFLMFWAFVNIIPIIFIVSQSPYYLFHSYAPLVGVIFVSFNRILNTANIRKRNIRIFGDLFIIYSLSISLFISYNNYYKKDNIFKDAGIIKTAEIFFSEHPENENYVIDTENIFIFDRSNGPQLWLNKYVNVYSYRFFHLGEDGSYTIINHPITQLDSKPCNKIVLNKSNTLFVKFTEEGYAIFKP